METRHPRRVMIVEDDAVIAKSIAAGLSRWGYEPCLARDFSRVEEEFEETAPDLVLMDIGLPYYNGYYWCERIRARSETPVVFLSSRGEDMDIVMAMRMGGDDYIVKPFSVEVLAAKLEAVLRRSGGAVPDTLSGFCGARLDAGEGCLNTPEGKLPLTKNELRILQTLLTHKGQVVPREEIMLRLWDSDSYIDDNTLTVNMNRLRKKLETVRLGGCIVTRKGEGYLLHDE